MIDSLGVTDGLCVCVRDWLGVVEGVGETEGVTDGVGDWLGVTDGVGDWLGVNEGDCVSVLELLGVCDADRGDDDCEADGVLETVTDGDRVLLVLCDRDRGDDVCEADVVVERVDVGDREMLNVCVADRGCDADGVLERVAELPGVIITTTMRREARSRPERETGCARVAAKGMGCAKTAAVR